MASQVKVLVSIGLDRLFDCVLLVKLHLYDLFLSTKGNNNNSLIDLFERGFYKKRQRES